VIRYNKILNSINDNPFLKKNIDKPSSDKVLNHVRQKDISHCNNNKFEIR